MGDLPDYVVLNTHTSQHSLDLSATPHFFTVSCSMECPTEIYCQLAKCWHIQGQYWQIAACQKSPLTPPPQPHPPPLKKKKSGFSLNLILTIYSLLF